MLAREGEDRQGERLDHMNRLFEFLIGKPKAAAISWAALRSEQIADDLRIRKRRAEALSKCPKSVTITAKEFDHYLHATLPRMFNEYCEEVSVEFAFTVAELTYQAVMMCPGLKKFAPLIDNREGTGSTYSDTYNK